MAAYDDYETSQPTDLEYQTKAVVKQAVETSTTEQPTATLTLTQAEVIYKN